MERGRSIRAVSPLLVALVLAMAGEAAPAVATAPPPPLDACLGTGSFNLDEPACGPHRPAWGIQSGPIGGVITHAIGPGDEVTLTFQPTGTFSLTEPETCGDAGCIWHSILWRSSSDAPVTVRAGCGPRDLSCTVRYGPRVGIGDSGEVWSVLYAQHLRGRFPLEGIAHALYAAPRLYQVRLEATGPEGGPRPVGLSEVAYAVRPGSSAVASSCVAPDWVSAIPDHASFPIPDCIALGRWAGPIWQGFSGWLPADSGEWRLVASPLGDASAPLTRRPSTYDATSVFVDSDDVEAQIVQKRRPVAHLKVEPSEAFMSLGTVQDVKVTVSALDGDDGLLGLRFDDPEILDLTPVAEGEAPLLEVVEILGDGPTTSIVLGSGTSLEYAVRVRAIHPGSMFLGASVSGTNDLGVSASAADGRQVTVSQPGGDGTVDPPVVAAAVARPDGGGMVGSVTGQPGSELGVMLWTAPATPAGGCAKQVTGPEVRRLGSTEVTVGPDGSAAFRLAGDLVEGWQVYGVATAGRVASEVGRCATVTSGSPALRIEDATVEEGTGDGPATELPLAVSLSWATDRPVEVTVRTVDGSAAAPSDYRTLKGVVVIPPGTTSVQVVVPVVADGDPEPEETFAVSLAGAVEATLVPGDDVATATILDDDGSAGPALDVRGTWRAARGDKTTLVIRTQDPGTGQVTGTLTVPRAGKIEMTGTLDGRRLTLRGRNQEITGTMTGLVARKNGVLTVTFAIKDDAGRSGKLPMRLVDPAG